MLKYFPIPGIHSWSEQIATNLQLKREDEYEERRFKSYKPRKFKEYIPKTSRTLRPYRDKVDYNYDMHGDYDWI